MSKASEPDVLPLPPPSRRPQPTQPAGDVGTAALTALTVMVTTAVLPFVQALVSKAAEEAYGQARDLIRRLIRRAAGPRDPQAPPAPEGTTLAIVDDPEAGISLHLRADVSDEALQALASFDLAELIARKPDQGRVRLVWHPSAHTWRIRGEA